MSTIKSIVLLTLVLSVPPCLAKDKPPLSMGFQKAGLKALIVVMNEENPESDRAKNAMDDAEAEQNNASDEAMFSDLLQFAILRHMNKASRECKNELEAALRARKAIDLPKSCHF